MKPGDRVAAQAAVEAALARAGGVTERERDLINAQAARYNGDDATTREPLDIAYAQAM